MPAGRQDQGSGLWIVEFDTFGSDINLVSGSDAPVSKDKCARAFTVADCVDGDSLQLHMHNGATKTLTLKAAMIGQTYYQNIAGIGTGTSAGVVLWVQW